MSEEKPLSIWIARDYLRCSGCRRCEVVCSLHHEGRIWPEASRIRVFMLVPGAEIPHLCVQCPDYPCVKSCPVEAMTVDEKTGAVRVDKEKCTGCGNCIEACPGQVPHLHPSGGYALICDLCDGDPECVKACQQGRWNTLWVAPKPDVPTVDTLSIKLYARTPEETTKDLAKGLYGDTAEELI